MDKEKICPENFRIENWQKICPIQQNIDHTEMNEKLTRNVF